MSAHFSRWQPLGAEDQTTPVGRARSSQPSSSQRPDSIMWKAGNMMDKRLHRETPNSFVEDHGTNSGRKLLIGLSACTASSGSFKRWTLDLNRWPLNHNRWTLDIHRWTLYVNRWTLDLHRWSLNLKRWTLDPNRWILDLNRLTLDLQVDATSQQRDLRSQQVDPRSRQVDPGSQQVHTIA